ncbi:hypothetical protein KKD87_05460 [bacterium]|nr:hypothetical protein [bacterium]MBU1782795.1 hypothetical protein [bacterium]
MVKLKKNLTIVTLILILIFSNQVWAQEKEEVKESKSRRFEILFNASLPFTLIFSYLLISGIESIASQGKVFSVKEKDRPLVLVGAVTFSSLIAFRDLKKDSSRDEKVRPCNVK